MNNLKTNFNKLLVGLPAFFLLCSNTFAQSVTTDPVGFVKVSVLGGSINAPKATFFSLPLRSETTGIENSSGIISSVSNNSFTVSNASWSTNIFSSDEIPYYLEITTNVEEQENAAGSIFQIISNTADTITVNSMGVDITELPIVSGVDTYRIFPGDTLLSALGNDLNGVIGGTSPGPDVDTIYIQSEDGIWRSYYYNINVNEWRQGAIPLSKDTLPLGPGSALIYARVGGENLDYIFTGTVPTNNFRPIIPANSTTSIATYFPIDQTLGNLGFENLPWWQSVGDPGIDIDNADLIYIESNGFWSGYHYNQLIGQWRKGAIPLDASNTILPVGSGLLVARGEGTGAEQANVVLPY